MLSGKGRQPQHSLQARAAEQALSEWHASAARLHSRRASWGAPVEGAVGRAAACAGPRDCQALLAGWAPPHRHCRLRLLGNRRCQNGMQVHPADATHSQLGSTCGGGCWPSCSMRWPQGLPGTTGGLGCAPTGTAGCWLLAGCAVSAARLAPRTRRCTTPAAVPSSAAMSNSGRRTPASTKYYQGVRQSHAELCMFPCCACMAGRLHLDSLQCWLMSPQGCANAFLPCPASDAPLPAGCYGRPWCIYQYPAGSMLMYKLAASAFDTQCHPMD